MKSIVGAMSLGAVALVATAAVADPAPVVTKVLDRFPTSINQRQQPLVHELAVGLTVVEKRPAETVPELNLVEREIAIGLRARLNVCNGC